MSMSGYLAPKQPSEADYDAIHAAVMETERGRWFLSEYARRNRHADTDMLMNAIERIGRSVAPQPDVAEIDRFRMDVIEMSRAIARTHIEIAAIRPDTATGGRITEVSDELGSIVTATETATSDILAAAEWIQETAWTMREGGADMRSCDELDEYATSIYTSCSFQDLTAQRTRKVMETLAFLETRITAMIDIWGFSEEAAQAERPAAASPQEPFDPAMSQEDVDFVLVDDHMEPPLPVVAQAEAEPNCSPPMDLPPTAAQLAQELVEFDALSHADEPPASPVLSMIAEGNTAVHPETYALLRNAVATPEHDPSSDEFLFADAPRPAQLQLVPDSVSIHQAIEKVRSGTELSADEAAKALDALKRMPIEDRTRIFT
jgi:hypothetical protein